MSNSRLTAEDWEQDVRHIVLDIKGSGLRSDLPLLIVTIPAFSFLFMQLVFSYLPGDIVAIRPKNPPNAVKKFLEFLGYTGDEIILEIKPRDICTICTISFLFAFFLLVDIVLLSAVPSLDIQCPVSLRELFSSYFDFLGQPKRFFFELLSQFATDEAERNKLKFIASNQGYDDYFVRSPFLLESLFLHVFSCQS